MSKQVQIDSELFYALYRLIVLEECDSELLSFAKNQLDSKFNKLVNHSLYSKYKTADSEDDRENARKEYLESIGIHKDFVW